MEIDVYFTWEHDSCPKYCMQTSSKFSYVHVYVFTFTYIRFDGNNESLHMSNDHELYK